MIHDPTVNRTSNGSGRINQMTLPEIKDLDVGSWFKDEFKDQHSLALQEVLDLIGIKARLNIHIKKAY